MAIWVGRPGSAWRLNETVDCYWNQSGWPAAPMSTILHPPPPSICKMRTKLSEPYGRAAIAYRSCLMVRLPLGLLLCALGAQVAAAQSQAGAWTTYRNERFGFGPQLSHRHFSGRPHVARRGRCAFRRSSRWSQAPGRRAPKHARLHAKILPGIHRAQLVRQLQVDYNKRGGNKMVQPSAQMGKEIPCTVRSGKRSELAVAIGASGRPRPPTLALHC
jgi:hypothetical protein